ncbi:MAG TPA: cytochrome C oxidase subunit IV family protein [Kofleriaceae bacterium]|jgi:caa(3)-type oxidase subunit IV
MRALVVAYVTLLALAALSWLAAMHDAGTGVALGIAAAKTAIIGLVFMELRRGEAVDRAIAAIAILFVLLLCAGALTDVALR